MWNKKAMDELISIHDGRSGTPTQQKYLRNYMMFYGMNAEEPGNQHYSIGYQTVVDMMMGKKHNPFIYIEYEDTHELIYTKEE